MTGNRNHREERQPLLEQTSIDATEVYPIIQMIRKVCTLLSSRFANSTCSYVVGCNCKFQCTRAVILTMDSYGDSIS